MKYFDWDINKNKFLIESRGISFEEIVFAISNGNLIEVIAHPNKEKYPNQKIFVVDINNYIYLVPFIENKNNYFLKTIYPSRNATKIYSNKYED